MVIMAEISSLSPPLDFKEEGLGRMKVVTALLVSLRTVILTRGKWKRESAWKWKIWGRIKETYEGCDFNITEVAEESSDARYSGLMEESGGEFRKEKNTE